MRPTPSRVRLLATGGTIASTGDPATGAARATLTAEDLVAAVPSLATVATVSAEQVANVPSQALGFEDLLAIGRRLRDVFADGHTDGAVVTQGTMTMEESAYFWDLCLGDIGPVVITGAMRHASLPSPDGPRNLLDAVTAAADPATGKLGVLVCMNGELHAARDVIKGHSTAVDAFRSPGLGPVGFVRNGRVVVHRTPSIREHYPVETIRAQVRLVKIVADDDGALIEAALERGAHGLVLEVLGGGAVPPACMTAIAAAARRIPVVAVPRAEGAMHEGVYASPGGDRHLAGAGVIFGGSLTGPKARVKLLLVLSAPDRARDDVAACFDNI